MGDDSDGVVVVIDYCLLLPTMLVGVEVEENKNIQNYIVEPFGKKLLARMHPNRLRLE